MASRSGKTVPRKLYSLFGYCGGPRGLGELARKALGRAQTREAEGRPGAKEAGRRLLRLVHHLNAYEREKNYATDATFRARPRKGY